MEIDYQNFEFVKRHYPEIVGGDIVEDHHIDWYDGPLSGVAIWQDKYYYYALIGEQKIVKIDTNCEQCGGHTTYLNDTGKVECDECVRWPNCFGLYQIDSVVLDRLMYWNNLFKFCVENGELKSFPDIAQFLFKFYYARRKKDYKDIDMVNEVVPVGWFKW